MKTTRKGCPICNKKDELYLKRTSPIQVLGCHRCEKKVKELKKNSNLTDAQIIKILSND